MALWTRGTAATRAQLGDAAVPEAHAAADVPDGRDQIPAGDFPADEPPLSRYNFALRGLRYGPDNPAPDTGDAGVSTTGEHDTYGRPDSRRQDLDAAGYPLPAPGYDTSPEYITTQPHGAVDMPGVTPLTAARAGSTSADPAHTAGVPRYLYDRPFDQWAAHHPPTVSKLGLPSPLASTPITQSIATEGGQPSPGGVSGITRMLGDVIHRNTIRSVPTPYDETAIVGTAVTPPPARRWQI